MKRHKNQHLIEPGLLGRDRQPHFTALYPQLHWLVSANCVSKAKSRLTTVEASGAMWKRDFLLTISISLLVHRITDSCCCEDRSSRVDG